MKNRPSFVINTATISDADTLAELILESGYDNLVTLFESPDSPRVLDYLKYALTFAHGQFGYTHHQVVRSEGRVVACGSYWSSEITNVFRQATLKSLLDFYGVATTQEILTRSEKLAQLIPAPETDSLGLGHIAVAAGHRRQGWSGELLSHFAELAKALGKHRLTLDVSAENEHAILAYQKFGFTLQETTVQYQRVSGNPFKPHVHMQYLLK